MASFLKEKYKNEIVTAMMEKMNYSNIMQVPKVQKIVLNMGVGEATQNIKLLDAAQEELALIAGQAPVRTKARKSISNFKVRQGNPVGCAVTLRGERMYHFLERLFNIVIPRIRDFRGVSRNSFDGRGNYSLGVKEHINFPELDYDKIETVRGLDITIVTSAKTDEEAYYLLEMLGMPYEKN